MNDKRQEEKPNQHRAPKRGDHLVTPGSFYKREEEQEADDHQSRVMRNENDPGDEQEMDNCYHFWNRALYNFRDDGFRWEGGQLAAQKQVVNRIDQDDTEHCLPAK